MWAAAIPAVASLAGSIIGSQSQEEAAEEAQEAEEEKLQLLREMFGEAKEFLSPFQLAGKTAIPELQALEGKMADPVAAINQIMQQFQMSPYQKNVQNQAINAVQSQLAAQGLIGSGLQRGEIERTAGQVAGGFGQQFLQNVLGEQARRAQILENLFGTGASAASALAGGALGFGKEIGGAQEMGGLMGAAGSLLSGQTMSKGIGSLGEIFSKYFGQQPQAQYGSNIWLNPDTGKFVPIGQ
jgi:hypothetical protein